MARLRGVCKLGDAVQIAPVNYTKTHPHFDHLIVSRVEPTRRIEHGVHITRIFEAHIMCEGDVHRFELDAAESEDLVHALATLFSSPAADNADSMDEPVGYDIEIGWRGRVYRIHGVSPGADDAIRAIVRITDNLIDRAKDTTIRRQPIAAVTPSLGVGT